MKPRSLFSSFLFLCLISLLLFLLPSPKVAWPLPSLETLAKVGKVFEKLMEEGNLAQKAIHSLEKGGLFERFLGKGVVETSQFKRSPALLELMQEFKQLGHSEAEAEKLGSRLIAELGENEAKSLLKVLGRERLAKLLPHLSPKEIKEFLTLLGDKEMLRVCDKFGGDVMKYYGPQFFERLPNLINEELMNHVIFGEGIWDREVHGCHDAKQFLTQIQGQGIILKQIPHPHYLEIEYLQYQMFRKGKDGKILSPLQLATAKGYQEKTIIYNLEKNQQIWQARIQEALEDAVKKKRFLVPEGTFLGDSLDISFVFHYYRNRISSTYPAWRPGKDRIL